MPLWEAALVLRVPVSQSVLFVVSQPWLYLQTSVACHPFSLCVILLVHLQCKLSARSSDDGRVISSWRGLAVCNMSTRCRFKPTAYSYFHSELMWQLICKWTVLSIKCQKIAANIHILKSEIQECLEFVLKKMTETINWPLDYYSRLVNFPWIN